MDFFRVLSRLTLGLTLWFTIADVAYAASATDRLTHLDKTTYSGSLDVQVSVYAAPAKGGSLGAPHRYPATLLFERPDRFRLVLRPGAKDELRVVAEAGVVRWLDLGTGLSGKERAEDVTDPLALALLGTAGEILRFTGAKDIAGSGDSMLDGAILTPRTWDSPIEQGVVWFSRTGIPLSFEFRLRDRSRVVVSILNFEQNAKTGPDDFRP
jgi:outer membrane lipoprotein-sorting protein